MRRMWVGMRLNQLKTVDETLSSVSYAINQEIKGQGMTCSGYNEAGLLVSYKVNDETICQNTYNEQAKLLEQIYPKQKQSIKNLYDSRGLRSTQIIKGRQTITFHYTYDDSGREIKRVASDGTMRVTKYLDDVKVISYSNKWGKWFNRVEPLNHCLKA